MNSKAKPNFKSLTPFRLGSKILGFFILILSAVCFQLWSALFTPAFAAQKLPILQLEGMKGKPFQSVLKAVENSGYTPRTIREADFMFNVTPQTHRYVLLPLGSHVSEDALFMLRRYMDDGGKLVLIPPEGAADSTVNRIYQMIGLPVSGVVYANAQMAFLWKGLASPNTEHLDSDTKIAAIEPSSNITVLATWGEGYPAIVTTGKGAILNWQWGRQLSTTMNTIALAKVMPLAKPESFIFLQQKDEASAAKGNQNAHREPGMIAPAVSPNPHIPVSAPGHKSLISVPTAAAKSKPESASKPAPDSSPNSNKDVQPATPASAVKPQAPSQASSNKVSKPNVAPVAQTSKTAPSAPMSRPVRGAAKPAAAPVSQAVSQDDEVLNNILGTPPQPAKSQTANPASNANSQSPPLTPDDPLLKEKMDAVNEAEGAAPATAKPAEEKKQQQHFSFLSPEAADVIAPEFDYGVYSMNLRMLDDYKRRIRDALETSRQLSLDMPEDRIKALQQESNNYKRRFESLYLGGKTQQGLDAFTQARHSMLQALALATTSPKVEGRAIWLDRSTIIESGSPAELRKKIQKLHHAGINIVYFETLNAGFPIYPSALLKNNPMVQGWDPLKTAVDEGHRLGMEVHAWVWAFAVGNRRHNALIGKPDDYSGPILSDLGLSGEALRNRDGGLKVDDKQHEFWVSPASARGREFLLSIYKEIVSKYDVDGLQLDYIRYPFQTAYTRMGYESVGREQFYRSTGASLDGLDDYTAKLWIAWKTYQVSSFVHQVSSTLKAIKPNLKLSAAVFPMRRETRIVTIQQDWETWIDNGWIDTLSPMSYTSDPQRLQGMFEYVQGSPKRHPLIYPGIALPRLDGGQLVQQLEAIRDKGGLGSTMFAGAHLDAEKIETLANGPYKEQTCIPPHRDVVKSLQIILADYQQKFDTLSLKGALGNLNMEQAQAIKDALSQVHHSLAAIGPVRSLSDIPKPQLQQVQQDLKLLQIANETWNVSDKESHPFRAQYFEKNILLMNELLGYISDRVNGLGTATGFKPPAKLPSMQVATPQSPSANAPAGAKTAVSGDEPTADQPADLAN